MIRSFWARAAWRLVVVVVFIIVPAAAQAQNIPSDQRAVRLSWGCVGR